MKRHLLGVIVSISGGVWIALAYGVQTIIYEKPQNTSDESTSYPSTTSYQLIRGQITVGLGGEIKEAAESPIDVLQDLEAHTLINIIQHLDMSEEKAQDLENYLKKSKTLLLESDFVISNMQQELLILNTEINDCLTEKNIADQQYFRSLQNHDKNTLAEALEQSQEYGQCAEIKRIELNAQNEILKRLKYYNLVLSQKFDYLSAKESLIIQDFDSIKDDIVEELDSKMVLENL